jgi:hypothetical protein
MKTTEEPKIGGTEEQPKNRRSGNRRTKNSGKSNSNGESKSNSKSNSNSNSKSNSNSPTQANRWFEWGTRDERCIGAGEAPALRYCLNHFSNHSMLRTW